MNRTLAAALLCVLALPAALWAKDEILPGKKAKERDARSEDNPMYDVAGDMDTVSRRLKEGKTDDTTQEVQEKIVEKLDTLIEQAQKESEKQPQGGKGDSQRPKPQAKPQPKPSPEEQQKEAERKKQEKKPATAEEK